MESGGMGLHPLARSRRCAAMDSDGFDCERMAMNWYENTVMGDGYEHLADGDGYVCISDMPAVI